jgi:hypothetical protein
VEQKINFLEKSGAKIHFKKVEQKIHFLEKSGAKIHFLEKS